jgi:hypothetical protein
MNIQPIARISLESYEASTPDGAGDTGLLDSAPASPPLRASLAMNLQPIARISLESSSLG